MRLGGPVFKQTADPEAWVQALRGYGYSAAYCPNVDARNSQEISDFEHAAKEANIVIAEVAAWSNPIDPDDNKRRIAIANCQERLEFADRIGASCCVNIAGARGEIWDGPYPDNLTEDTFELIVDTVREIVDAVKPTRTFYTLETMPWVFPDSVDSYLRLIQAIDRKGFAVHLDPVNLINSPLLYFQNAAFLKECFAKLGPYIKSLHAKDIIIAPRLTVHLDETRPGLGFLNYKVLLQELSKLDKDIPLMLEHLSSEEEYEMAAGHIRSTAVEAGLYFV